MAHAAPNLGRPLWLVSNRDVPIDRESAPLDLVSDEPIDRIRTLAEVVVAESDAWKRYVPWLGVVHPNLVKEIRAMATKRKKGDINWDVNIGKVIRQLQEQELGLPKHIVDAIGVERILAALSPAQRREARRRLQADEKSEKAAPVS
jgi:hypothetical protein